MTSYVRQIIGSYTPLQGEGIATVNWEYITACILLIISVYFCFKILIHVFKVK